MEEKKRLAVILQVRVPEILRGCDQQRYIERKLIEFGLRLRPPPNLAGTSIPVGYGLVSTGVGGWDVVEARGDVAPYVTLLELIQHELVEDAMDEAAEEARRARRAADFAAERASHDPAPDDEPEGGFASGGPMPHPLTLGTLWITMFVLKPLTLITRGLRNARRWYVRERG